MEKDPCREVVYFTVSCDHPYLVSLTFAILLSLHLVTLLLFVVTCVVFVYECCTAKAQVC